MSETFEHVRRLYASGDFRSAEQATREGLAETPADAELWSLLGAIQRATGRALDAINSLSRALSLAPGAAPGLWANLGNAHLDLKQMETAAACHRHAVSLLPNDPTLHYDFGSVLMWASRPKEAAAAFSNALRLDPNHAPSRLSRAQAWLSLGEFEHGWADYEARIEVVGLRRPEVTSKVWHGEPYPGKRLLILSEQGHGDAIWVSRYFGRVKALGGELIVECQEGLVSIFSPLGVHAIPKGTPLPEHDLHCFMCSLPGLFTKSLNDVPGQVYLDESWWDHIRKFSDVFSTSTGRLRVGIVWSGSVTYAANAVRAISLSMMLRAVAIPGVQLFSLQKGPRRSELKKLPGFDIIDLDDLLGNFADTAAALQHLDLVIMTDSAVAHLCGAMGKPAWILLNSCPYWLWMTEGCKTPWYPSIRLFRSHRLGDWSGVLDQVAAELTRMVIMRNAAQPYLSFSMILPKTPL